MLELMVLALKVACFVAETIVLLGLIAGLALCVVAVLTRGKR